MHKRFKAIAMAIIMAAFTIMGFLQPASTVKAASELTVNIHYHRYADDYDGWNIWSWIGGGEGASYDFNKEDDFWQGGFLYASA